MVIFHSIFYDFLLATDTEIIITSRTVHSSALQGSLYSAAAAREGEAHLPGLLWL